MPFSFPASPALNATSTQNGREYRYAGGNVWELVAASGGGGSIVTAATVSAFPATGSSSGVIYVATDTARAYIWAGAYIELGASGGGGGSGNDTELRALFAPGAPTIATVSGNNAQATVSWTAPTGVISQAPITGYVVEWTPSGGSASTVSTGSTGTSYTKTSLANGTAVTFRVAAVNSLGQGSWSSASSAVTPSAAVFQAIPDMTSNTAPSGQVLLFGTVNNGFLSDGSNEAWHWFSRSDASDPSQPVISVGSGIGYAFSAPSLIGGFAVAQSSRYTPNYSSAFTFSGSNDGSSWTTLYQATGLNTGWDGGVARNFTLPSSAAYTQYRWIMNECPNTYAEWCKVQLLQ
jgi:hypothetical protein